MIALLGNLSRDFLPGRPPRTGGAPYHAARALQHLDVPSLVYARCAAKDGPELLPPLAALGTPVRYLPGERTASFEISYQGDVRQMFVRSLGDTWLAADVPVLEADVTWVHVAPLARTDFPPETLAAAGRGRRLSLDGQGLVRPGVTGELRLDADYDPELLRHVWMLKLNDEEAGVLGDPLALPVRELVLTHGSRGATVHANGRVDEVRAYPLEGDPTGAGDAFCVAYIAARSTGFAPAGCGAAGDRSRRLDAFGMIVLVATAAGTFSVDPETDEVVPADPFEPVPGPKLNLPRVIATAESGSTVIAVVDTRPPMLVSHDAGTTWRESGRGLPPGRAVAIAVSNPDRLVYAGRNRLYLSRDGGVFWTALEVELPEIEAVALMES